MAGCAVSIAANVHAAVDEQLHTVDVARLVRSQEHHDGRDQGRDRAVAILSQEVAHA